MPFRWFSLLVAIVVLAICNGALAQKSCAIDQECKGQGVCLGGSCKTLGQFESLLDVYVAHEFSGTAVLYLDRVHMGALPWRGIVSAGQHLIRVEADGMLPVELTGESRGGAKDSIPVSLQPAPAPPVLQQPQEDSAAQRDGETEVPGTFHVGLYGGGNYGTGSWRGDWKRPVAGVQGGLALGLRALREPVWLDVGLAVSSTSLKVFDASLGDGDDADWGDFLKLHMGVFARLLFPIKKNFLYLGAELEPGYGLSGARWLYVDLHLAMSIFLGQFFEIRINPLGVEYLQELEWRGWIASYHATLGVVVRFPRALIF